MGTDERWSHDERAPREQAPEVTLAELLRVARAARVVSTPPAPPAADDRPAEAA